MVHHEPLSYPARGLSHTHDWRPSVVPEDKTEEELVAAMPPATSTPGDILPPLDFAYAAPTGGEAA